MEDTILQHRASFRSYGAALLWAALLLFCLSACTNGVPAIFQPAGPLDLTGETLTAADYEAKLAENPDREILWMVPLSSGAERSDAVSLTLPALTADDAALLAYFPKLAVLDASGSDCYDALLAFSEAHPDCALTYTVELPGAVVSNHDVSAVLTALPDPAQLSLLPALETVDLTAAAPEDAEMDALLSAFPDKTFLWQVDVYGVRVDSTVEELDLTGTQIADPAEVDRLISYLPKLQKLILSDCGLENEQLDALNQKYPDVRIVWTVYFNKWSLRTDATAFSTKNASKNGQSSVQASRRLRDDQVQVLKYCTDLVALDLGHNEFSDISFLENLTKLQILILVDNHISDISVLENLKDLVYVELFLNRIEDVSALGTIEGLLDLNICYNNIKDPTPLYNCKKLERLWISANRIDPDQWPEIAEALPNCKCIFKLWSSTKGGWREHERYFWMHSFFYPELYPELVAQSASPVPEG